MQTDDAAVFDDMGWSADDTNPAVVKLSTSDLNGLKSTLLAQIGAHAEIRVDAADLERVPSSLVQLLLVAARESAARGKPLIILNPSIAVSLAFETLGLDCDGEPFKTEYA